MGDVAMALGLVNDHSHYWSSSRVERLVTANLLEDYSFLEQSNLILEFGETD
jgi:hypothetical protein